MEDYIIFFPFIQFHYIFLRRHSSSTFFVEMSVLTLARQKQQLSDFGTKSDHSSFPRDHTFSGLPLCWSQI